ncbi:NDRG3 isoform X3 [Brachionus plicatilis]|uniref:NDRG3 isoform X3 n=1 Tax=Brachionus plicatilis TaxID=10195 RepID=A0A3M7QCN9_BRAPC|nr:NDRG3 isoform X3 [Brachionus plicatilis]
MADFELTGIEIKDTNLHHHSKLSTEECFVRTRYGQIFVTIQGNRAKTPIITFPDIGLNSKSQFHGFFDYPDNQSLMESFCCYHINALGQEESAPSLPQNFVYPTCDQLAETVVDVINHFNLKAVICFGVGLGANILSRFCLLHPDLVNGCVLLNCVSTKCGWIEWGYQKWNRWYLSSGQYTEFTNNYLLWHHFGYKTWENNHDLVQTYSDIFSRCNPVNLSLLINSYINRTDLGLQRPEFEHSPKEHKYNFRCSVLNVMGDESPHDDDVVDTNGRLDPSKSAFVKFADCGGMILEEQPAKMSEALRHFLQGLGYVPHLSITTHSLVNRHSEQAIKLKLLHQSAEESRLLEESVSLANVPISLEENKNQNQIA